MDNNAHNNAAGQLSALCRYMRDRSVDLRSMFAKGDTSGDGSISAKELHTLLGSIGCVRPLQVTVMCDRYAKELHYAARDHRVRDR